MFFFNLNFHHRILFLTTRTLAMQVSVVFPDSGFGDAVLTSTSESVVRDVIETVN